MVTLKKGEDIIEEEHIGAVEGFNEYFKLGFLSKDINLIMTTKALIFEKNNSIYRVPYKKIVHIKLENKERWFGRFGYNKFINLKYKNQEGIIKNFKFISEEASYKWSLKNKDPDKLTTLLFNSLNNLIMRYG